MHAALCTCTNSCICICTHVCVCEFVSVCVCVYVYVICIYISVHMCVCESVGVCVFLYMLYVYVPVYVSVYAYTYYVCHQVSLHELRLASYTGQRIEFFIFYFIFYIMSVTRSRCTNSDSNVCGGFQWRGHRRGREAGGGVVSLRLPTRRCGRASKRRFFS